MKKLYSTQSCCFTQNVRTPQDKWEHSTVPIPTCLYQKKCWHTKIYILCYIMLCTARVLRVCVALRVMEMMREAPPAAAPPAATAPQTHAAAARASERQKLMQLSWRPHHRHCHCHPCAPGRPPPRAAPTYTHARAHIKMQITSNIYNKDTLCKRRT